MAGKAIYNTPSYGYLTTGTTRSVFYAPYDVDVDVNLDGGSTVTVFDAEGNKLTDPGLTLQEGRLTGSVAKFNLVVIS